MQQNLFLWIFCYLAACLGYQDLIYSPVANANTDITGGCWGQQAFD